MKTCTLCKVEKPISEFGKHKRSPDGIRASCKKCNCEATQKYYAELKSLDPEGYRRKRNTFNRQRYKNNPQIAKNCDLKRSYGIDLTEYNRIFLSQNGCCAICGKHQSLFKKSLAVDHCHSSEAVRGLLCSNCNIALGLFKDEPVNLNNAAAYLQRPKIRLVGNI